MAKAKVYRFSNSETEDIYRVCAECRDLILDSEEDIHNQEPWEEVDEVTDEFDDEECENCGEPITPSEDEEELELED